MRRPSAAAPRHGVFHELHRRAVPREEERAGAFQALLGQHLLIGLERELGAHRAVGPHDARDFRAGLVAKAEVKLRAVDGLHLHKQPGADFDLAADAEGIDALVAGGLVRARANDLPVIILRAAIDGVDGLPIGGKSKQIEPAVGIRRALHRRRARDLGAMRASVKCSFSSASQMSAPGSIAVSRRRRMPARDRRRRCCRGRLRAGAHRRPARARRRALAQSRRCSTRH